MPPALLVLVVVALAALGSALALVRRVPAGHAGVRQRMGRFDETLAAGWHLKLPGDRVVAVYLGERVLHVRRQPVAVAGARQAMVEADVGYRVLDAYRAVNEVTDVAEALEALLLTVVGALVETRDVDDATASAGEVGPEVRRALTEAASRWGVEVSTVDLRFDLPV